MLKGFAWIALVCFCAAGCQSREEAVANAEAVKGEAIQQAKWVGGEATAVVRDIQATLERIQRTSTVDDQAKSFIKGALNHSSTFVQEQMIPVIHKAIESAPSQKEWLVEQLRVRAQQASGASKVLWENAVKKAQEIGEGAKTNVAQPE